MPQYSHRAASIFFLWFVTIHVTHVANDTRSHPLEAVRRKPPGDTFHWLSAQVP